MNEEGHVDVGFVKPFISMLDMIASMEFTSSSDMAREVMGELEVVPPISLKGLHVSHLRYWVLDRASYWETW